MDEMFKKNGYTPEDDDFDDEYIDDDEFDPEEDDEVDLDDFDDEELDDEEFFDKHGYYPRSGDGEFDDIFELYDEGFGGTDW